MKKILLLNLLFAAFLSTFAQANIATTATASCNTTSGGTTSGGGWNWVNINNGVNNSCGSQEAFIWTRTPPASTDYMDWTWTSPKTIGKIIFHNAWNNTRNMTGCQVQYWNGSAFVNWYQTSNSQIAQACIDSISFNPITTTILRITDIKASGTGQTSNLSWREIQIINAPNTNYDAGAGSFSILNICNYTQALSCRVFNYGKFNLDSVMLHWSINNTLQTPIKVKGRIRRFRDTLISLNPSFSLVANTTYNFKVWTSRPNNQTDSVPQNDTLNYSVSFFGNPNPPTALNYDQCGNGFPRLIATPNSSADTIMWYDSITGGNLLGIGRNIQGPFLTSTRTFFAQSIKFGGSVNVGLGNGGTTILSNNTGAYNGYVFNVNCINSSLVDSITVRLFNNTNQNNLLVYIKTGTAVGFQTNSAAWTLVNSERARFFNKGGQFFARISAKNLFLTGGVLYGFYVTTDPTSGIGNDLFAKNGTITAGNANLSFTGIGYVYGLFGTQGLFNGYSGDVEFMVKNNCTNTSRVASTITVKPRPIGALVNTGTPFQGQVKLGIPSDPDITEIGKTVTYEMAPPTGYTNADHGATWEINNIVARTRRGVIVPSTEYSFVAPSAGGSGKLTFIPKAALLDSFITFSFNYSDLGPHFCDSTIRRTLVVAPTPKVDFKFPASICLGEATLFENTSTIHSGNSTFIWRFGNGDTSDLNSPVYEFNNSGVYQVKLEATSFPWKVKKDTTITVEVGELPTIFFRINNKCDGNAITFLNGTTVGTGSLSYEWDFGDGSAIFNTNSSAVPPKTYPGAGVYRVTLIADANGCKSTLTKNAYVFAKPVANFTAPTVAVCANTAINFVNTSTISSGLQGSLWNFNDAGKLSTATSPSYTYTSPRTYQVTLISVSEFECRDSIKKTITIAPSPKPNFMGDQLCDNKLTNFSNTSVEALTNPVYTWTFSDGFTSTQREIVNKSWANNGPVTISLKSKYSNNCEATTTRVINILIQPKASFEVADICSGETARFVNTTTGDRANIQYAWDFGNGTDVVPAPLRVFTNATTQSYTVKLAASYLGGCSDTFSKTLNVSESPICNFTVKNHGNLKYTFTPSNTTYTKYEWFTGEGGYLNSPISTYTYSYNGNFVVKMKASNQAGCDCEITQTVGANTSVNNVVNSNGISIYPNPNNGTFTISNANSIAMTIEVYNVLGSKVLSKTSESGSALINLNTESKGVYLIKVSINSVTTVNKITVTN